MFFDEKRTRWHGFLIFSGSALATITFLAGVIWFSVAMDPQFKPLPPYLPDAEAALTTPATSPDKLAVTAPDAQLGLGIVPPPLTDAENVPPAENRVDADVSISSPVQAQTQSSQENSAVLSKIDTEAQQILRNSPSITVLDGSDSNKQWVSYVGLADEVRSPGFFTLVK